MSGDVAEARFDCGIVVYAELPSLPANSALLSRLGLDVGQHIESKRLTIRLRGLHGDALTGHQVQQINAMASAMHSLHCPEVWLEVDVRIHLTTLILPGAAIDAARQLDAKIAIKNAYDCE